MTTRSARALRPITSAALTIIGLVSPTSAQSPPAVIDANSSAPSASYAAAQTPTPESTERDSGPLHISATLDFTNSYYFRGLVQERGAFIAQPGLTVGYDILSRDDFTLTAQVANWDSFHDTGTDADTDNEFLRKWYEADFSGALVAAFGKWTCTATYIWETSPSNAFNTVQEFDLSAAYEDEGWLPGTWKLRPALLLAAETGANAAEIADSSLGWYLQPSINPGFETELPIGKTEISFPLSVGLSLHDYYQNESGDDETFGFVDLGAKISVALPISRGDWSIALAAHWLALGGHAAALNDGRHNEAVFTLGLAAEF